PVVIVRGYTPPDAPLGPARLIQRPREKDLFR
ncbi:MAG: coenzyme F420-0:L-glutamate ligase, partial [Caldilineae bacterium]